MRKFIIEIINDGGCILYHDIVEGKDENEALINLLKKEIIYVGDTIKIVEEA